MYEITNFDRGAYAGAKDRADRTISSIDNQIDLLEVRIEQREKTIRNQFTVLESLVSSLNAQSDFITQQMDMLSNLWSK